MWPTRPIGSPSQPAGRIVRLSVLLGADGVRSTIRTGYFGHPGPASFGRSAWRAVIPAGEVDRLGRRNVGLWLGNGAHLVHYPVRAGADLNIVAICAGTSEAPPAAPFKFLRDVLDERSRLETNVADWRRCVAGLEPRPRRTHWRRCPRNGTERRAGWRTSHRRRVGTRRTPRGATVKSCCGSCRVRTHSPRARRARGAIVRT